MDESILVVNCGSSSLKLALFDHDHQKIASALAERLNQPDAYAKISGDSVPVPLPANADHNQALASLVEAFRVRQWMTCDPIAIGHRVVHGGETFRQAVLIDPSTITAIDNCAALAPLHNPVNLAGIRAMQSLFPDIPHVAVFDTAFHQTLPARAYRYALPDHCYQDWGIRRYGFHGTSHQYMAQQAAQRLGKTPATTSIISAHLGNGCSITAIRDGLSVDTSMGLTPLEGLVMGTRSGDVDPGLFDYLAARGISSGEAHRMLNNDSGLLGLSGQTNDMRSLCELADHGHEPSQLAIDVFCFRLARYTGAMTASLSHLDALVFTGGIGENSPRIRQETVKHLGLLGIRLDPELNRSHGQVSNGRIDTPDSRYPVLVIPTNEELVIAREAARLAAAAGNTAI
ncbi:acetate kinase [Marinobacter daepoensis]|uniref:Acetate kinase n=1 Tax=Marinobacter daepoensis TaxID=262077 RepID=A0ABS3BBL6_9GAMM|nr:acetate kinase [Marinobacter daepoensis]MBN7769239.1 acetate kinase [Marinobacter daepoensis]MBY6077929.1 acetate kinase [Marinobacter daepoensis]